MLPSFELETLVPEEVNTGVDGRSIVKPSLSGPDFIEGCIQAQRGPIWAVCRDRLGNVRNGKNARLGDNGIR